MYNVDVRSAIRQAGFYGYEVAAFLGVSETHFSRQLTRGELSTEKKENIMRAIMRMTETREAANAAD